MAKPNCYKCIHRGEVPGSCHSRCNHPANAGVVDNPLAELMGMLGKRSGLTVIPNNGQSALNVVGHEHGVRSGWFLWPMNFDPVWLVSCDGFEPMPEKESK